MIGRFGASAVGYVAPDRIRMCHPLFPRRNLERRPRFCNPRGRLAIACVLRRVGENLAAQGALSPLLVGGDAERELRLCQPLLLRGTRGMVVIIKRAAAIGPASVLGRWSEVDWKDWLG